MITEYQDEFTVSALTNFYQPKGTRNALTNKQLENPLWVPQPPAQPGLKEQTTSTLTDRLPEMTTEYQEKFLSPVNNKSIVTVPPVPDWHGLLRTGTFQTNIQMGNSLWAPKPPLQPINSTYSDLSHVVGEQVVSKLDSKGLVVTNSDSMPDCLQERLKPLTSYRSDYCNHPVRPLWLDISREDHPRIMDSNFSLAPQNHALCQQMKTMEVPFRPSCLPPISKTNFVSKDATTQEEQAIKALMEMPDDKRRAMLEDISADDFGFCRLYVMQERELKEKAEGHSIADELWAKLETDKSFWEEVKLKAQKKIEEHIMKLEDKVNLAPCTSSKLPPISKTIFLAPKDAPMKLETSKQFVLDNQDAIMGLMEMTDEERRGAMLESISVDCFCIYTLYVMREKELREMARCQSKVDKLWANLEMAEKERRTPILDPATAHRLHTMREKELREEAERRSKAAILKDDMEADKSFWEEGELLLQKERAESTKVQKFNLNTVAQQQHARRQQMTASEVPINPFDPPYVSKSPAAAKDTFKKEANNQLSNSPQAAQHPKYGTWNVPACWPRKARSPVHKLLNARNNVELMRRMSPSSHNFTFTELRHV